MADILSDGLHWLCGHDPDINKLITPRHEKICQLLTVYIDEIERCNPALSLVGTSDRHDLITRHILDSLAPLGILIRALPGQTTLGRQPHIADVGSGAGLPGIPLAITLPDIQFTLIERKGRRAGFLRNIQTTLGLSNVSVEEEEMEKVQKSRFALVVFRAFRPLEPKIYKKLLRLCDSGGALAAYKGRHHKIEAELAMLEQAMPNLAMRREVIPCTVPGLDEERHLLLLGNRE